MASHYLYSNAEIRAMESAARASLPADAPDSLMQMAGEAVAARAIALHRSRADEDTEASAPHALVLVGPGDNGGDALVAAHALHRAGWTITLVEPGTSRSVEPAAKGARVGLATAHLDPHQSLPADIDPDIIIDGLFGIGLARAPTADYAALIEACNALSLAYHIPILAIDTPSGLNTDTGVAFQPTVIATATITFIGDKPGLHTADGRECAGDVFLETLGAAQLPSQTVLQTRAAAARLIPSRRANSHKGTWGSVAIIGGASGMVGAAVLAARAALHMGPGKVYLGLVSNAAFGFDPLHPEIITAHASDLTSAAGMSALAIGMGMGTDAAACELLMAALTSDAALLLDADALNLLAQQASVECALSRWCERRRRASQPQLILTPHPGEAARLLGTSTVAIQSGRIFHARQLAKKYHGIVVLKGSGTVIATPTGACTINSSGNAGMASGGMGDALSGMLAALMAMGLDAHDAAQLGVYLHGAAADAALHHGLGPHGLTASEVIFEARTLLNNGLDDGD